MSEIKEEERFRGDKYNVVAWARGQRTILYQTFGSYQGEWLLLAERDGVYYVYKDYYGSCSGCDSFEATFGWNEGITKTSALDFAKGYPSFVEIPRSTMENLVRQNTLEKVMPANIRSEYSDLDVPGFCQDAMIILKLDWQWDITVPDILACQNQEIKQQALKAFGFDRFMAEAQMVQIDQEGPDALVKLEDIVFLSVQDASTPRRYLLRVPPTMRRVKEAVAWTFGMTETEYNPLQET